MKLAILSDLHGNLEATREVGEALEREKPDGLVLLGDLIDYGMCSNEVVSLVRGWAFPVLCNLRGNHEQAVLTGDFSRFSTERGRQSARYTQSVLTDDTLAYLRGLTDGPCAFDADGARCFALHGSPDDVYWGSIRPGVQADACREYDYVFSGHSHLPHYFEVYYPSDDPSFRNRKRTAFLNPGSVGQPRNHIPHAQFALLDTATGDLRLQKVPYDVAAEQRTFRGQTDDFYRERLEKGI